MVSLMRPHGRGSAKWLADFGQRLNDYAEWVRSMWSWLLITMVVALVGASIWRRVKSRKDKKVRCDDVRRA